MLQSDEKPSDGLSVWDGWMSCSSCVRRRIDCKPTPATVTYSYTDCSTGSGTWFNRSTYTPVDQSCLQVTRRLLLLKLTCGAVSSTAVLREWCDASSMSHPTPACRLAHVPSRRLLRHSFVRFSVVVPGGPRRRQGHGQRNSPT